MRTFLRTLSLTGRTFFITLVYAFMITNVESFAILFAFTMEWFLKAVAAFARALMIAFEIYFTFDFASFFFEVLSWVFGTRKVYFVTAWKCLFKFNHTFVL